MYKLLLLMSLCCLLLAGCSSNVENEIIGEWKGSAPNQTLIFHRDRTVEMKSPAHSTYTGSYTIEDGNKMTFVFPNLYNPTIKREAKIRGDKLILTDPKGQKEEYIKQ